ncbi:MAG TPA: polysaccharide deacetylase family protein [Acidimicrobiales bacterium]|nr:polysaccharide deacetylase family protein [Acidimicrobiales bacterium]
MDRRRFLALAGIGAAGAATGATGTGVVIGRATASAESPGAVADVRLEQPLDPRTGTHRIIWSVETERPLAALTFDDGPDPDFTPRILDILEEHGARGTFMMMGYNVALHPDIARRVVDGGHEVGNHTWSHLNLLRETDQRQYEEIARAHEAIEDATGEHCAWFRPPRGQLTGASVRYAAALGYDTLLWSVERGAPGVGTPDAVADYVEAHLGAGDIIDLHDGIGRGTFDPDTDHATTSRERREVEVDALPRMIRDATDRGLELVTMSDLLAAETSPLPQEADDPAREGDGA